MKKKLLVLLVCGFSVLGASATILYTSSCGKQIYTIDESYFDNKDEAKEYYDWLDHYLCDGEDVDVEDVSPEKP